MAILKKYVLFAFLVLTATQVSFAEIRFIFRYDDLSADMPGARDRDEVRALYWDAEKRMDALFEQYGYPYHIAIVPVHFSREREPVASLQDDQEKLSMLKLGIGAGRIEVSQHGFNHLNHATAGYRVAEFRQRSYLEQIADILQGKKLLEEALETEVDIFVPPFNAWNASTAKALGKAGFRVLSADRLHTTANIHGLKVIPYTITLHDLTLMDLRDLPDDCLVVVLFHPTDLVKLPSDYGEGKAIADKEKDFEYYLPEIEDRDNLIEAVSASVGDFSLLSYNVHRIQQHGGIRVTTFTEELQKGHYGLDLFNVAVFERSLRKFISSVFRPLPHRIKTVVFPSLFSFSRTGVYVDDPGYFARNIPVLILLFVVLMAAFIALGVVVYFLSLAVRFKLHRTIHLTTIALVNLAFLAIAIKNIEVVYRGFQLEAKHVLPMVASGAFNLTAFYRFSKRKLKAILDARRVKAL